MIRYQILLQYHPGLGIVHFLRPASPERGIVRRTGPGRNESIIFVPREISFSSICTVICHSLTPRNCKQLAVSIFLPPLKMKTTVPIIYRHLITSAMGSDSLDASTASSRRGNLQRRQVQIQEFCGKCIFGGGGESCEERAQSLVRWTSSNLDTGWTLERAKSSVLNDWDGCTYKTSSGISNGAIVGTIFSIMIVLLCVLRRFVKRRFDSRDDVKDVIRETDSPDSNDEPHRGVENGTKGIASNMYSPQEMEESKLV